MTNQDLDTLAGLIRQERDTLLSRWRTQVRKLRSAQHLDIPKLNDHIPLLLDELVVALQSRSNETIPEALEASPPIHGLQRVQDGFDIEEVVAEYNILRGCIHDVADANGLSLQGQAFHILNRVLDGAIGVAVQTFATQRAREVQQRRQEYLAFVAHDLRTPLSAISFATRVLERVLREQSEASAAHNQMFRTLRRNVQHLDDLVGKVLKENTNLLTDLGITVERREFDLWPLVEALIDDLHPIAGTDGTRLTNSVPDDLVIFADAALLRRVLQNLIANAIKYTPRGEVIIGAQRCGADGGVECWVSDNGAGIPAEHLGTVFDKLETDGSGLGLGLAIVKTFVEAHDGTVTVESKEGFGSTFRFSLPPQK